MLRIAKILFPVDFSERSTGAARYVEALAGRFQARIQLLHVVSNGERALAEELLPARQRQLDEFLTAELRYFDTEKVCVTGDPAARIVEAADAWSPDLVMIPTHGLGLYRRLLLGSVTAKVLHDLDCPVWTDVHAEDAPPLERIHVRRILCAVDLQEQSRALMDWGAFLSDEYSAQLGIVHAVPPVEANAAVHSLDEEFSTTMIAEAKGRLAALQAEAGTDAATFVEPGDAARVVQCAAKKFGADLLIIGRHARAGFSGRLQQHAYSVIRESPCPVISI